MIADQTQNFSLEKDPQGRLVLKRPGQPDVSDVRIRRAFPWSRPSYYISIRSPEGAELLLEDLAALPPDLTKFIETELAVSSFIPRIQKILHVDVRFGFQQWQVKTDRGPIEFRVQEREDIRFMPDGRFSIKDADGNLYEMASLTSLDDKSRRAIEALL
jgi:hypothetical protein